METPAHTCPRCQSTIPADAPGGICPGCALLAAANPSLPEAVTEAPSVEEVAAAFPELEVRELIGQGGMGVVFKACQPRLDRLVALKILPPHLAAQPGFAERFTREARALARLNHPHIVAVYDFGESGGFYYLTMEFVEGVNLRQAIRAGVTPEQALALVPRLCEALQFAHDKGVLHRDIKPENILLDTRGTVKLADFGIAKMAGDQASAPGLTASGSLLGTAAYMAPEQIEKPGTVDHRADIYSLGVVFYEMLTGELPIGRFAPPSEKSSVSTGVDDVVFRALEKERDRRQQSATEMRTQVEGLGAAGAGVRSAQPPPAPRSTASPAPTADLQTRARRWWSIPLLVTLLSIPPVVGAFTFLLPVFTATSMTIWLVGLIAVLVLGIVFGTVLFLRLIYHLLLRSGAPRWLAIFATIVVIGILIPVFIGLTATAGYLQLSAKRPVGSDFATEPYAASAVLDTVRPEAAPSIGKFSQGSVELVAVNFLAPPEGQPWWRMDGKIAADVAFETAAAKVHEAPDWRAYQIVLRTHELPPDASTLRYRFPAASHWKTGSILTRAEQPDVPLRDHHLVTISLPGASTLNFKAGVATSAWTTVSRSKVNNWLGFSEMHRGVRWTGSHGAGVENKEGDTTVTFTHASPVDWETRVVAVTATGQEVAASFISSINEQTAYHFARQPLSSLDEFRFQVRPIDWVEFVNIPLQPRK